MVTLHSNAPLKNSTRYVAGTSRERLTETTIGFTPAPESSQLNAIRSVSAVYRARYNCRVVFYIGRMPAIISHESAFEQSETHNDS